MTRRLARRNRAWTIGMQQEYGIGLHAHLAQTACMPYVMAGYAARGHLAAACAPARQPVLQQENAHHKAAAAAGDADAEQQVQGAGGAEQQARHLVDHLPPLAAQHAPAVLTI